MSARPRVPKPLQRWAAVGVDWLRGDASRPPLVPLRLLAALWLWPALLFVFFLLPEVRYHNVPPLFAPQADGASRPGSAAGQPQIRALAVLAHTMEGEADQVWDPGMDRRTHELRERVGANILHAAGYLGAAYLVVDKSQNPPLSYYALSADGAATGCAGAELPAVEGDVADRAERAANLAVAIVAVEKFNRHALHRATERAYARTYLGVFGRLPDLSYGPAQIRPSFVRRLAALQPGWPQAVAWASLPDQELLALLGKECEALKIVATFALHRIVQDDGTDEDIAAAYAGQRRRSSAPIDYAAIVAKMVSMMRQPLPVDEPPAGAN
jgi:hypothetical protein